MDAPWFSEHLSFNRSSAGYTGPFLPPRQTAGGLERCVASIRTVTAEIDKAMAIETGANYLRPRRDEIDDGRFISLVAEEAACGILLDLQNVYTNARNGRQSIEAFVGQLDLERVIEVHIAGGMELDGDWLDAHSGALPPDLIGPAAEVIASLPNLKAIVFEVHPAFLVSLDERTVGTELERIRTLWEARDAAVVPPSRPNVVAVVEPIAGPTASEWERDLAAIVAGHPVAEGDERGHFDDPRVALLAKLSLEHRVSMITTNLPRTTQLLLLALGEQAFGLLLNAFRDCCASLTPRRSDQDRRIRLRPLPDADRARRWAPSRWGGRRRSLRGRDHRIRHPGRRVGVTPSWFAGGDYWPAVGSVGAAMFQATP